MSFFRLTQNAMHATIVITVKIILFFQVHETSRFPSICCVYLVMSTYNDPKRFLMSQQHVNESFSRYPTLLRSMFCVCKVNSFNMAERRFFHRLFTCKICIYWHVNYNSANNCNNICQLIYRWVFIIMKKYMYFFIFLFSLFCSAIFKNVQNLFFQICLAIDFKMFSPRGGLFCQFSP